MFFPPAPLAKNLLGVMLGLLFAVEIFSLVLTPGIQPMVASPVLRISEIDGPRIDHEAAVTVVRDTTVASTELFIFLLLAYGALLIFNFSYTFATVTAPQWRLEALITACALLAWRSLDPDGTFLWFPFMILKTGIIFFSGYLYLLEKRILADSVTPIAT